MNEAELIVALDRKQIAGAAASRGLSRRNSFASQSDRGERVGAVVPLHRFGGC